MGKDAWTTDDLEAVSFFVQAVASGWSQVQKRTSNSLDPLHNMYVFLLTQTSISLSLGQVSRVGGSRRGADSPNISLKLKKSEFRN